LHQRVAIKAIRNELHGDLERKVDHQRHQQQQQQQQAAAEAAVTSNDTHGTRNSDGCCVGERWRHHRTAPHRSASGKLH